MTLAAPEADLAPDASQRRGGRLSGRALVAVELVALAVAPVLAFFVLRVRPMYNFDSVDANIYTGYSHNGADLVERWGPGVYYWVRLGAILPERLAYLAFGSVPGFYVLRYALVLLIIVPLYAAVRSASSRAAGWLVVSLFLTSPVMYVALGSDYPDSVIFGYLGGAFGVLFIPWRSWWARAVAWVGAGMLMALALHSQVTSAAMIGGLVLAYGLVQLWRRRFLALAAAALCVAAGVVAVTGLLVIVARRWVGYGNIFSPTITNYQSLQEPQWLKLWHSSSWTWVDMVPYVAVPVVVALAWVLTVAATRARRMTAVEAGAGIWLLSSGLVMYALQFRGTVAMLEYRLYSSSLWVPTLICLGFVLVRIVSVRSRPDVAPRAAADDDESGWHQRVWWVTGAVWAVALLASFWTPPQSLVGLGVTLGVSVVLVVLALAAGFARRWWSAAMAGLLVLGLVFLTVSPTSKPFGGEGFSVLPVARYDQVLGHSSDRDDVVYYELATQIFPIVGPSTAPKQIAVFWASDAVPGRMVNAISGTYLWWTLPHGIPDSADVLKGWRNSLGNPHPDPLVVLAMSDQEAESLVAFLTAQGLKPEVTNRGSLDAEGVTIQVWVVHLG